MADTRATGRHHDRHDVRARRGGHRRPEPPLPVLIVLAGAAVVAERLRLGRRGASLALALALFVASGLLLWLALGGFGG